ncbi:MAG: hypothetical protein ACLU4J_08440 [Butyricimonas paravirosa]
MPPLRLVQDSGNGVIVITTKKGRVGDDYQLQHDHCFPAAYATRIGKLK